MHLLTMFTSKKRTFAKLLLNDITALAQDASAIENLFYKIQYGLKECKSYQTNASEGLGYDLDQLISMWNAHLVVSFVSPSPPNCD